MRSSTPTCFFLSPPPPLTDSKKERASDIDDDGVVDEAVPVVEDKEEETKVGVVGVDLAEGFPGDVRWAAEAVVVTCSCFFVLEELLGFVDP